MIKHHKLSNIDKSFSEDKYPLQKETYQIIRICMEVHRILGKGLLEIVDKGAIAYEMKQTTSHTKEKRNIPLNIKTRYCRIFSLQILSFLTRLYSKLKRKEESLKTITAG